jgi:sporulation related protein
MNRGEFGIARRWDPDIITRTIRRSTLAVLLAALSIFAAVRWAEAEKRAAQIVDDSTYTNEDRLRNLRLLSERPWTDIPMVYGDKRRAIITIEKGASGDRAFKAAFAAWGQTLPTATPTPQQPQKTHEDLGGRGGGFVVQLSSQRSEEDALASYRALQSKFPDLLGMRAPIIKRADLGSVGVHYRAVVGPFETREEASLLCDSLRTAGGHCVVQRNY